MASENDTANSGSDTPVFRLDLLPEELRIIIFKCLVPARIPTGTRLPPSADVLESRKGLHSLCLTSRLTYPAALPLLYRHVIFTDYVQIASLLVTLDLYPLRRTLMRNVSALVRFGEWGSKMEVTVNWARTANFMDETVERLENPDTQNPVATACESVDTVETVVSDPVKTVVTELRDLLDNIPTESEESEGGFTYFRYGEWDWYESQVVEVYERLLHLLLQAPNNIEDILTIVPEGFGQSLCPQEMEESIIGQFLSDPNQPVSENPFNNLRSVRKQNLTGYPVSRCHGLDPLQPEHLESKEWEFFRDDVCWSLARYLDGQGWPRAFEPPRELIVFSHITTLRLYQSRTHPAILRLLLSSCKTLESLTYTTLPSHWSWKFVPLAATEDEGEIPVPTLQQALDEVKETLMDLCLGCYSYSIYPMEREEAALAPHRVDVSDFPRLTSSQIDPAFVRNHNDALD